MPILYPASNRFKYARSASDFRARRYAIQNPPAPPEFSPSVLFAAMEQGAWYDPSDMSTLFQDSAGVTPVTAVEQPVGLMLDKSGRGNHAFQTTATSRPVLSARVNRLLATETLATQTVTTLATTQRLRFEGTGSITLSGTGTGTFAAGTHTVTTTAGTLTVTVSGSVLRADLREANNAIGSPDYQRVNTATDYDAGPAFPRYLRCDGIDDGMVTGTITPGTDKAQVFAGVRKLSDDVRGAFVESYSSAVGATGGFGLSVPGLAAGATYRVFSGGSIIIGQDASGFAAPITNVLTGLGDISGDLAALRVNGTQAAQSTADQGAGNYLAYPLYLFRRGGTTLPFNGHFYGAVIRFGPNLPIETIEQTEAWMAAKTGVTL